MKKYSSYKKSDVYPIKQIPEHWQFRYLQVIASKEKYSFTGGPFGSDLKLNEYTDTGVRIIQLQNIGIGRFLNKYKIFTSEEKADELISCNIYPNEIIVAKMADPVARACIMPEFDERYLMASDGIRIKPDLEKVDTRYIVYSINSSYFKYNSELNSEGTTRLRIGLSALRKQKILLPPLKEQTAIANYLDRKTEELDLLIDEKKQLVQLYQEEKTAVINRAVTKGINPNAILKDSGIEWLGNIPEHWEDIRLKYLGIFINGYSFKSTDFKPSGVRVLKISNIQHMSIDWSDESFIDEEFYDTKSGFRVLQNDLVFALTRPIISTGIKVALMNFDEKILLNQRNSIFRPKTKMTKWIYFILLSSRFVQEFDKRIDKTGQQPNISSNDIGEISIPVPAKEEQTKIVEHIERESAKINAKITKAEKYINLLTEYRTALISEVVTGKIKVID